VGAEAAEVSLNMTLDSGHAREHTATDGTYATRMTSVNVPQRMHELSEGMIPRSAPPRRVGRGPYWKSQLKSRRIRVNAVSPGSIDTPGLNDLLASSEVGEQRRKAITSAVPLGRFGTPDEIAKAVVFLASDDASYVTGAELFVDGGFAQV
jgi:hypothetical protein